MHTLRSAGRRRWEFYLSILLASYFDSKLEVLLLNYVGYGCFGRPIGGKIRSKGDGGSRARHRFLELREALRSSRGVRDVLAQLVV